MSTLSTLTLCNTDSNHGFTNHLRNFNCWAEKIGFKFLLFALDDKMNKYWSKKVGANSFFWEGFSKKPVSEDPHHFRSNDYNLIVNRKMEASLAVLKLGYDIIFIDVDVAVLEDPVPYLIFEGVEYVHSENNKCPQSKQFDPLSMEGNTGFYYARSTPHNIKIWTEAIAAIPLYPGIDDQTIFWNTIRVSKTVKIRPLPGCPNSTAGPVVRFQGVAADVASDWTTCGLDVCLFSSGSVSTKEDYLSYSQALEKMGPGAKPVTVHANFISGNKEKKEALDRHGYWLFEQTPTGGKCNEPRSKAPALMR